MCAIPFDSSLGGNLQESFPEIGRYLRSRGDSWVTNSISRLPHHLILSTDTKPEQIYQQKPPKSQSETGDNSYTFSPCLRTRERCACAISVLRKCLYQSKCWHSFDQGGKNRRRGKNENDNEKRELVFKEDGQEYAQVIKMLGNGRLEAKVRLFPTSSTAITRLTNIFQVLWRPHQTRAHSRKTSEEGLDQPRWHNSSLIARVSRWEGWCSHGTYFSRLV